MEKEWKAYEIGELDQYLFGQGNHYEIYKKLGAHMVDDEGTGRSLFCSVGTECEISVCSRGIQ